MSESEMVERVAQAIYDSHNFPKSWDLIKGSWGATVCREEARAAIAAMREPTEEMIKAARFTEVEDEIWRAMIDEALR